MSNVVPFRKNEYAAFVRACREFLDTVDGDSVLDASVMDRLLFNTVEAGVAVIRRQQAEYLDFMSQPDCLLLYNAWAQKELVEQ